MTTTLTLPANELRAGDITIDPMFRNKVQITKITLTEKQVVLSVIDLDNENRPYSFARRLLTKTKVTR